MSSAFDAASVAGTAVPGPATSKTLTWSHTCTGTDLVLSVWVAVGANPDTGITVGVTYAGVAMTGGAAVHNDNQTVGFIQRFTLVGPLDGANSVVITLSAIPDTVIGGAISATGSSGTGTEYTAYGDSGGDGTGAQAVTIAVNTAGNLIGAGMGYGSPDAVAQSPSTARWDDAVNEDTGGGCSVGATTVATGSSLTMHWAGAYDFWGLIAVEFLAAGGGSTPVSGSDSGAGANSGTVAAALGGADTGSGADSGTVAAAVPGADTGSGAELGKIGVPGSDSGSAADAGTVAAALGAADAGSGAGLGKIGVTGTDGGSGADSGSVSAAATGSDTGSGAGSATVGVAAAETASGADAGTVAAAVPAADAGSGADTARAGVTGTDGGSGADTATVTLGAAAADSGTGADTAAVTAALTAAEAGSGAGLAGIGVLAADTGAGADSAAAVPLPGAVSGADSGTGADFASVAARLAAADAGSWADSGFVPPLIVLDPDLIAGTARSAGTWAGTAAGLDYAGAGRNANAYAGSVS